MSETVSSPSSGGPVGGLPSVGYQAVETSAKVAFDNEYHSSQSVDVPSAEMDFWTAAEKEEPNYSTPAPSLNMEPEGMPTREVPATVSRTENVNPDAIRAAVNDPPERYEITTMDRFNMSADDFLYHQHPANEGSTMVNKNSEFGRIDDQDRHESAAQRLEALNELKQGEDLSESEIIELLAASKEFNQTQQQQVDRGYSH